MSDRDVPGTSAEEEQQHPGSLWVEVDGRKVEFDRCTGPKSGLVWLDGGNIGGVSLEGDKWMCDPLVAAPLYFDSFEEAVAHLLALYDRRVSGPN